MIYRSGTGACEQLELDLFPGVPWAGRSPRGLTRVGKELYLRQEPLGHEVEVDPTQLLLWADSGGPFGGKGPDAERGAPTLLPLARTRRVASREHSFPWRW